MYMATITFADAEHDDPRETLVFSDTLEGINEKISKVREMLHKRELKFVSSIVEEIQDVSIAQSKSLILDDVSIDDKIVH